MKDQTINKLETAFKNYYLKRTTILNVDSFKTNNIALTKALSSGEKIICYVQKGAFTSCALRLMQDLSILEEEIGRNHTIIATNIGEKNYPLEFPDFDFPTVFVETFYFPDDFSQEPIVFVCDSLMNIKLFYLPETFPQFRKQYFNEYLPAYFEISKAP
jgi:hypothetical protein